MVQGEDMGLEISQTRLLELFQLGINCSILSYHLVITRTIISTFKSGCEG